MADSAISWGQSGILSMADSRKAVAVAAALVVTACGHIVLELLSLHGWIAGPVRGVGVHHLFSAVAVAGWAVFLGTEVRRAHGVPAEWGIGLHGWMSSAGPVLWLMAAGTVLLLAYGWIAGRLPLRATFWMTLVLYPFWGLAQQFALQVLFHRNIRLAFGARAWTIPMTGTVFALAHLPQGRLMLLTFVVGLLFSWIWASRDGSLWPIAIAHGWLGALAYYLVLGRDPLGELLFGGV